MLSYGQNIISEISLQKAFLMKPMSKLYPWDTSDPMQTRQQQQERHAEQWLSLYLNYAYL